MRDGMALTQRIQQEVLTLPEESLPELERFIESLRSKFQALKPSSGEPEKLDTRQARKLRGILKGYDFSSEFIAEARREMWHKFYVEEIE